MDGPFACVALFEFQTGPPEKRVLYEGEQATCEKLARAIERKSNKHFEALLRKDGTTIEVETVAYGLRYDGDREPIGFILDVLPLERV